MAIINLGATADRIQFSDEIWAWIELLEDVLRVQQEAHVLADATTFLADTDYKKVLVAGVHNARQALHAIDLLLRFELVNQAAAQVRLLCEGLITLEYIAADPQGRATRFWEYAYIEAYERAEALMEWEAKSAAPEHTRALVAAIETLKPDYERLKPTFEFKDGRGRTRAFNGWANKSIAQQASECGERVERLYSLVYKTMSAYVHGSGWSLRKQGAYSMKHYDAETALVDFAEIIRTTLAVWVELANFCYRELGWDLIQHGPSFAARVRALDAAYQTKRRKP